MNSLTETRLVTPARILVRSVNWLGDAVMTTPALLRLREAHPDAFIAVLSPEKLADLWVGHPAISMVLRFAPKERASSVAARLEDLGFQVGLALPNSFRSAFELWLAGVPNRVGYRGQMRRWLLTHTVAHRSGTVLMRKRTKREILDLTEFSRGRDGGKPYPAAAHQIYHYLRLVRELGASAEPVPPQLHISAAEVEGCLRRLKLPLDPSRPLFALNPGAEYGPAKRWPAANFIAAAREVQKRVQCRWVLLGGKGDVELAKEIAAGILGPTVNSEAHAAAPPVEPASGAGVEGVAVNLAGATTLRELCAVLKACRVLLTNDTGPMHVAAALGTPVVALFGSTSPELTGPGLPGDARHRLIRHSVPCAPCFLRQCPIDLRCLRGIEVPKVVQSVLDCAQAP